MNKDALITYIDMLVASVGGSIGAYTAQKEPMR